MKEEKEYLTSDFPTPSVPYSSHDASDLQCCLPRLVDLNDHRVVRSLQAELLSRRALLPCLPPLRVCSTGASELAFTHLLHNQYSTSRIRVVYKHHDFIPTECEASQ